MGYRSDVAMFMGAHTAEDYAVFKVWFDQYKPKIREWWFMYDDYFKEVEREDLIGILFRVNDAKWYEHLEAVQVIEELYADFYAAFISDGMCEKYTLEFIRIGEDHDDVEDRVVGNGNRYLYVSRSIGEWHD